MLIYLYDRKFRNFKATITLLKFLLLFLKEFCTNNNIFTIKFFEENINHYNVDNFKSLTNSIFDESYWTYDFIKPIDDSNKTLIFSTSFDNQTNSESNIYKFPYIDVSIENLKTVALLDSGATASAIDSQFVFDHNLKYNSSKDVPNVYGVDGKKVKIDGIVESDIKIGNQTYHEKFIMIPGAQWSHPVLLSCSFLEKNNFSINFANKYISNENEVINWLHPDSYIYNEIKSCTIFAPQNIEIKARDNITIEVKTPEYKKDLCYSFNSINKNITNNNCSISNARVNGLYTLDDTIHINLVNHSSMPRFICKNSIICSLSIYSLVPVVSEHCLKLCQLDNENLYKSNDLPFDPDFDPTRLIDNLKNQPSFDLFRQIIKDNIDVFAKNQDDIGMINNYEHHIELTDNIPVACRPFRTPHSKQKIIDAEIEKLKRCNIIRDSCSPYSAPCLIVYKKSGSPRLCIDFRKLNQKIVPISYPLPLLESSLQLLGGNRLFSSLDLLWGYHQIPIREEDRFKTAFSTGKGLYEYNRVPFGMITSGAAMQYAIERVLAGLNNTICLVYIDDILIYGKDEKDHDNNLHKVLTRLRENGFKVNGKKCHFRQNTIECLGHIISENGISPNPSKIDSLKDKKQPRNVKEVQSFIGLCSYYRRFVPNFSKIAKPIINLIKKSTKFNWTQDCETAFNTLKEAFTNAPVLTHPDFDKDFYVTTDASYEGLGGVLTQLHNKNTCQLHTILDL